MANVDFVLVEYLKELPREQRIPPLAQELAARIATMLGMQKDGIDIDAPFGHLAPALTNIPMRWSELLEPLVKEVLGFRYFHLHEASLSNTIRELASYLACELDPVPIPTEPLDEHNSNRQSGWAPPLPYQGTSQVEGNMAFVLGSGRSGTSLFRTMLSCHDRIFAPNELHLLNFDDMGQRRADIQRLWQQWMDVGLVETLHAEFGLTQWEAILEVKKFADSSLPVAQVYANIQSRMAGRWLIDKTPSYARHPVLLERAEQMFVNPRYFFMTRHPYAVMDSYVRSRFYRLYGNIWGAFGANPWHTSEFYWTTMNRNILDFLKQIPTSRWMRVTYEGLMLETEKVLSEACQLLSVPFDERMLEPYQSGISITGYLKERKRVEHGLAEAWRDKRPPHQLSRLTRQVAEELGYELP
ncbi:MAG: sulfotransferase family protein [Gallionellaceae bacterium]